jgi:murein L,D-transpeptidase YafK
MSILQAASFKDTQLNHSRVKDAYRDKEVVVKNYFKEKNISYNNFNLFIRIFKKEMKLEVWVKEKSATTYTLLHPYDVCSNSGVLGPKRKEGDFQVPEGIYSVNHFNPVSNFHLSLGVSYPNKSDKILSDKVHPGGAIYIHGNCVTIGCVPITDDKIKELYIMAVEARNGGQAEIPIHIFPARLNNEGFRSLSASYPESSALIPFWRNLKVIYDDFEMSKTIRRVKVNSAGEYYF